jgi:hypothetical protein
MQSCLPQRVWGCKVSKLSTKLPWDLAAPRWASELNPVIALPILQGVLLKDISLTMGIPKVVNHLLQRQPQGWLITDNTASATVWRTAAFNILTLTLEASADTTVSLWVF